MVVCRDVIAFVIVDDQSFVVPGPRYFFGL